MWRCSSSATLRIPSRKPGSMSSRSNASVEHVLAGLGQAALDHHVVERQRPGEQDPVAAVLAQALGHVLEVAEGLPVPPGELGHRRGERAADRAVADPDDLLEEALEEDRVARLVHLLRGEELLLLLERRGVDVGAERVGDGVLAVEEQREDPHRPATLLGRHALVPVDPVLREVDLGGAPVAALPARVQVRVADLLRCRRDRDGRRHDAQRRAALRRPTTHDTANAT